MQELNIQVTKEFIKYLRFRKLAPVHVTPLIGEQYKHHFVVLNIDYDNCILNGKIGTSDGDVQGQVNISIDTEFNEIGNIIQ